MYSSIRFTPVCTYVPRCEVVNAARWGQSVDDFVFVGYRLTTTTTTSGLVSSAAVMMVMMMKDDDDDDGVEQVDEGAELLNSFLRG